MATTKPRFSLTMDDSLLNQVENYQIKHGISTKSRAIQILVKNALDDIQNSDLSKDIKKTTPLEDGDEEILKLYHMLDTDDKVLIKGEIRGILLQEKYKKDAEKTAI